MIGGLVRSVAPGTTLLDLEHLDTPSIIATYLLETHDGIALVDPGPSRRLATLRARLADAGRSMADISAVLLTHIHLDHAGATGSLLRENPAIRVFVHERGARHLADPSRLVASARRIYGSQLEELWGEILAVPPDRLEPLRGGEMLNLGGRVLRVAYLPGHAKHHVGYLDAELGIGFVGDTGGVRIEGTSWVLPPTPPPDIDLEAWERSLDKIRSWQPSALCLTHFGLITDDGSHLGRLRERLREWAGRVRRSLEEPGSDEEHAARFAEEIAAELRGSIPADQAARYQEGIGPKDSWHGLARYWRTR